MSALKYVGVLPDNKKKPMGGLGGYILFRSPQQQDLELWVLVQYS